MEAVQLAQEIGIRPASRQLGVPKSTIQDWIYQDPSQKPSEAPQEVSKPKTSPGAVELENAGLKAQLDRLRGVSGKDLSAEWDRMARRSADNIKRRAEQINVNLRVPGTKPFGITFISDQHIGASCVDMYRMKDDAELIAGVDNLYAILGGDGIDNHVKIRSAMINADSTPGQQFELYGLYLEIFHEKIITALCGNHDGLWSTASAGEDIVGRLIQSKKIHYCRHECRMTLQTERVKYRILSRHSTRYNSSINPLHGIKQQWRLGSWDFDIGLAGHIHNPAVEQWYGHGVERWAAVAGSYQLSSDYSDYGGFPESRPTCPTFIMDPMTRDIMGFADLRKAARYLESC